MRWALGAISLTSGFLLMPAMASAVTFNPNNTMSPGDVLIVGDQAFEAFDFGARFKVGDSGGTYTFTFTNTSSTRQALTVVGGTVAQQNAEFTGGVDFLYEGTSFAGTVQGQGLSFQDDAFTIKAGSSAIFSILFGNVVDDNIKGGKADINLFVQVAAIPVPAAGLLLLTALGGAAALRRRKTA